MLEPRVQSRTLGRWRIHAIQAGGQKLDGGAMFGVVPKALWEKRIPPDERNRIQLGMRCLLVEHEIGPVLIDTGLHEDHDAFLAALSSVIDPSELKWLWLTHPDPDHLGSLMSLVERVPALRIVTTFAGMGMLSLFSLPLEWDV